MKELTANEMHNLRIFFHARFGRLPEHDQQYFDTWVERMAKGTLKEYADSESLVILGRLELI